MKLYRINLSITNDFFSVVRDTEILLKIGGISYSTDSLSVNSDLKSLNQASGK